jgi:DNA-directed RNA polymerase specialized sigma24 family protein
VSGRRLLAFGSGREIIGAPLGTVKSHVLRGRERLIKEIEKSA